MRDLPNVRALLAGAGYGTARIEEGVAYAALAGADDGDEGLSLALARILFALDDLREGARHDAGPGSPARPTLH